MLTHEQLRAIMPRLSANRNSELLPFLQAAMTEFSIESPARVAALLAQLAHESGQLRFMEEIWGPTTAQRRYEPTSTLATALGNSNPGDGKRFKGRGPIQITGRANYRRFGDLLGVDLVTDPARAAVPDLAFRIAGLFWSKKGLNELADLGTGDAFREITRRINGGFNGLDDRQKFYSVARAVLGLGAAPLTRGDEAVSRPRLTDEAAFERGHEAIVADVSRGRIRKKASAARKTMTRRATPHTRQEGPNAAKARTVSRQVKTVARGKRRTAARSTARSRKPALRKKPGRKR